MADDRSRLGGTDPALSCPRCGTRPGEVAGSVAVDGSETTVRVPVSCPGCAAPLALVVTRTVDGESGGDPTGGGSTPEAPDETPTVGVELWLEDRRTESESGGSDGDDASSRDDV